VVYNPSRMNIDRARLFDKRVVQRNIGAGRVTKEEYRAWLGELPDSSDKIRPRDEGGDEDGYDHTAVPKAEPAPMAATEGLAASVAPMADAFPPADPGIAPMSQVAAPMVETQAPVTPMAPPVAQMAQEVAPAPQPTAPIVAPVVQAVAPTAPVVAPVADEEVAEVAPTATQVPPPSGDAS